MRTPLTLVLAKENQISYFLRFVLVGLFNTVLNYLIYLLLFVGFNIHYVLAGISGFLSGALTGYLLNRNWTFRSNVPLVAGGVKYFCVQLICLTAHVVTQVTVVVVLEISKSYSQLAGIVITTFLNFYLIKRFVYAK